MSLITELKRRNVFRVGAAYGVVGWLLVEVASVVLPTFGAPDWVMKVVTFLVILGFPLALVLAWAFELTPEGIKLESAADSAAPESRKSRGRLDFAIVGLLVLAVVYIAVDKFLLDAEPEPVEAAAEWVPSGESVAVEKSIAVLPFVNMSPDPDNEFFSDGISEELLNTLARIPDLKVAARTSSFEFKGQNRSIAEIGRLLNVSNVLEGSVRKSGSRVRVTAQLVKVDDGFHLWSGNFDRELTDIFAIQDEIAVAIADAMKTTLNLSTDGTDNLTGTNSIQAYELYLQGMQNWHQRELSTLREAEGLFLRAIEIDPGFAKAHAGRALTYAVISYYSGEPEAPYRRKVNEAAGRALAIDPQSAEALAAMGLVETDTEKSISLLEQAIAINPSFATAYQWLGEAKGAAGNTEEWLHQYEHAFELDPRSRIIGTYLGLANLILGRTDDAFLVVEQVKTFAPDYNENLELEFILLLNTGQREAAAVVGKRLAKILNKNAPDLGPYLDLLGEAPQRVAAAEVLLSWPRDSRMEPDSPAILYDYNLFYVLAIAGLNEPALNLLTYIAKRQPRIISQLLADPKLTPFICMPDVRPIYASLPIASSQYGVSCPASGKALR
jgi:TolB-like protein/Tfp pilus assembly protein PilF